MVRAVVEITINGRKLSVDRGDILLHAAKRAGVEIPTLCSHEGLPADGNCRLCSVEVDEGGRKKLVASCMYPVTREISVETESERVLRARRTIVQLLVNRCPDAPIIKELCEKLGVEREERFSYKPDLCIRCGRCARACATDGTNAIELVGRGFDRHVAPPCEGEPKDCIGCLACENVCPTGCITHEEGPGRRRIWDREFETVRCERCGEYFATREMLDWAQVPEEDRKLCDRCRKYEESRQFLAGEGKMAERLRKH